MSNSVFVTTYAIGNEHGFAVGKWFDLSEYSDKDEFIESALQYVRIELGDNDPELCFSDNEFDFKVDKSLISMSHISKDIWHMMEMSDDEHELLSAFDSHFGCGEGNAQERLELAKNRKYGEYETPADFAYEWLENSEKLKGIDRMIVDAIDYDKVAQELLSCGYCYSGNFYFDAA